MMSYTARLTARAYIFFCYRGSEVRSAIWHITDMSMGGKKGQMHKMGTSQRYINGRHNCISFALAFASIVISVANTYLGRRFDALSI
jgi:hypothetical protein